MILGHLGKSMKTNLTNYHNHRLTSVWAIGQSVAIVTGGHDGSEGGVEGTAGGGGVAGRGRGGLLLW